MLTAAVIPLFWLLGPLLPSPLSGIVLLLLTVGWILFCFFVLLWGSAVILGAPGKKLFKRLICIAWFPFYTLLCWGWATLIILIFISIFSDV